MDVARAVLIAAIPFLVHTNLIVLLVIAFLVSCATVAFNPARSAVMPDLVPTHLLTAANSATAAVERISEIAGYLAAGAILALSGIPLVFAIDAMTFMVSAGLILGVTFPEMIMAHPRTRASLSQAVGDVKAGLDVIRQIPVLTTIFWFSFLMAAAASALLPLMVPLALEHLHTGNSGFSILEAALAVGATFGAILTGAVRTSRRGVMMILGAGGMGAATIFVALSNALPVTLIFLAAGGLANMIYLIPMGTLIQENTDTEIRGRVFAARYTVVQLGVLIGLGYAVLATSPNAPGSSVGPALLATGVFMVAVAAIASLSPALRKV
jgi:MFS family permease